MSGNKPPKDKVGLREDLLMENYEHPAFLPPLWRVIFQEGVRGNHMIFPPGQKESQVLPEAQKRICAVAASLFAAPDLGAIKEMVACLTDDERAQLYTVYQGMLRSLGTENQEWLN